jgi:hypothetical protein
VWYFTGIFLPVKYHSLGHKKTASAISATGGTPKKPIRVKDTGFFIINPNFF